MVREQVCAVAVLVTTLSVGGSAQPRQVPNLSGTWVPIPGGSTPAELRPGSPIQITQTESIFRPSSLPDSPTYRLDGLETTYRDKSRGLTVRAKAEWKESALGITEWYGSLKKVEIVYSVNEEGQLAVSTRIDMLGNTSNGLKILAIVTTRRYRKG
ncbi:MAG: hypothetical protein ABI051_01595 [Vicinamibacterales bacterium]